MRLRLPVAAELNSLLAFPVFHLVFSFLSGDPVLFLNFSEELVAFSLDFVQFIIGQLTPLFFHFAFDLLPIAFRLIPIHGVLL